MNRPRHDILVALSAAILATAQHAQAAPGEPAGSVALGEEAIPATQGSTRAGGDYSVRETVSDLTTIREYVSASGVVFGIAWDGLTHPDLTLLLGAYAAEYHDAAQADLRMRGRRCHQVKTDRLVVEQWGHMRHLQGRAYATLLVPPGMSADEIR